jgi:hypothetical protein
MNPHTSAFYSDPIDIDALKNSSFVRKNPTIQLVYIHDKNVSVNSSARYLFIYSDAHICVLVRTNSFNHGKPEYELYDSYPSADTRISEFILKRFQLCNADLTVSQRDQNSCLAYSTVYVEMRLRALGHRDAILRLAAYSLTTIREMAFRTLHLLE